MAKKHRGRSAADMKRLRKKYGLGEFSKRKRRATSSRKSGRKRPLAVPRKPTSPKLLSDKPLFSMGFFGGE